LCYFLFQIETHRVSGPVREALLGWGVLGHLLRELKEGQNQDQQKEDQIDSVLGHLMRLPWVVGRMTEWWKSDS
jgi:hypothetical protein